MITKDIFPGTNNEQIAGKDKVTKVDDQEWTHLQTVYEKLNQTDFDSIFEFMKVYRFKVKKKKIYNIFNNSIAEKSPIVSGDNKLSSKLFSHFNGDKKPNSITVDLN